MPEPWIFDLDGTLADSSEGILESMELALDSCGYPMLVRDPKLLIGPNLPISVAIANPNLDRETVGKVVGAYREYYNRTGHKRSRLYPGAEEALARLAETGRPAYILTNKIQLAADIIVRHLGLDRWIAGVFGQDSAERPKPERMMALVRAHNLAEGVLVGDGLDDHAAARAAGFRFLLARWGYGAPGVEEKHGPVEGLTGLRDLGDLLQK